MRKKIITIFILLATFLFTVKFFVNLNSSFSKIDFSEKNLKIFASDEMLYLKTFYLVKSGVNYYKALSLAFKKDLRKNVLGKSVFEWRLPTVYYFWSLFARNGNQIAVLFWTFAFLSIMSWFFINKKFVGVTKAFFAPLFLLLYFSDIFNYQTSIFFTEWWAWFFFSFGLFFLVCGKKFLSFIFFTLTVLTRELFIVPIVFFIIISFFEKKNRALFLTIFFIFIGTEFIHKMNIQNSVWGGDSRIHFWSKQVFQEMSAFSMRNFPFVKYKIHYFFITLSFIALFSTVLKKGFYLKKIIFLSSWSFILIFPFIGQEFNSYWGICYMPTLLSSLPLFFAKNIL